MLYIYQVCTLKSNRQDEVITGVSSRNSSISILRAVRLATMHAEGLRWAYLTTDHYTDHAAGGQAGRKVEQLIQGSFMR